MRGSVGGRRVGVGKFAQSFEQGPGVLVFGDHVGDGACTVPKQATS